jgi:hypothetical protein
MRTTNAGRLRHRVGQLAAQGAAVLVAAAFLAVAIAGFTPGLTTHLDRLQWLGHHSESQLFGVFDVSVVHNLLHLAFGVAGLLLAGTYARARAFLIGGGLIYLGLWLYGLLADLSGPRNVLPLNDADNWSHFSIGVVMILLGLTLAGARVPTGAGGEPLIDPD